MSCGGKTCCFHVGRQRGPVSGGPGRNSRCRGSARRRADLVGHARIARVLDVADRGEDEFRLRIEIQTITPQRAGDSDPVRRRQKHQPRRIAGYVGQRLGSAVQRRRVDPLQPRHAAAPAPPRSPLRPPRASRCAPTCPVPRRRPRRASTSSWRRSPSSPEPRQGETRVPRLVPTPNSSRLAGQPQRYRAPRGRAAFRAAARRPGHAKAAPAELASAPLPLRSCRDRSARSRACRRRDAAVLAGLQRYLRPTAASSERATIRARRRSSTPGYEPRHRRRRARSRPGSSRRSRKRPALR